MLRSIIFKILGGGTVITILVMWICLPFYWGSREWFTTMATTTSTTTTMAMDMDWASHLVP
jgi:hypothetical protein